MPCQECGNILRRSLAALPDLVRELQIGHVEFASQAFLGLVLRCGRFDRLARARLCLDSLRNAYPARTRPHVVPMTPRASTVSNVPENAKVSLRRERSSTARVMACASASSA